MDAIVIAGGIPLPEDPLYLHTRGHSKALLDIAGKPMIEWVLDALGGSKKVERVIIVGMTAKAPVPCAKPTYYIQSEGHILTNLLAGAQKIKELNPKAKFALLVSSDIPGITTEMVDWLIAQTEENPADIYYGVVPREIMEKHYPNSHRTWTHLKDMVVCGSDISVARLSLATQDLTVWEELIGNRKSPLKQAAIIGYGTLIRFLFRQLTLEDVLAHVCDRLGIECKAIIWPWAEPGMDVDKPSQLEAVRDVLSKRE
jgi:GTP:adenosylcobinamide-phosphate guanylyltransferase